MKYRIIGTTIPAVEIKFDAPGETMYTHSPAECPGCLKGFPCPQTHAADL